MVHVLPLCSSGSYRSRYWSDVIIMLSIRAASRNFQLLSENIYTQLPVLMSFCIKMTSQSVIGLTLLFAKSATGYVSTSRHNCPVCTYESFSQSASPVLHRALIFTTTSISTSPICSHYYFVNGGIQ